MKVTRAAFRARWHHDPKPEDPLFHSMANTRLDKQALWRLLRQVYDDARAQGIITRQDIEFSAHLFRRTAGTHLMRGKLDIVSI